MTPKFAPLPKRQTPAPTLKQRAFALACKINEQNNRALQAFPGAPNFEATEDGPLTALILKELEAVDGGETTWEAE